MSAGHGRHAQLAVVGYPAPDVKPNFYYARHFLWLGVAVLLLIATGRLNLFGEPFLPTFAINGALHATCLACNARSASTLLHKLLFIGIATVLSVAALYVGLAGMQLFAALPEGLRSYEILSLCAIFGALAYGMLVRTFWLPRVAPRAIIGIAVACAAATTLALFLRGFFYGLDAWWLTAAWWFAMSGGLWFVDTRLKPRRLRG